MKRGVDRLFDLPLIGLLLNFLFSERSHVVLATFFSVGVLGWLINLPLKNSLLGSTAYFLISIPVLLFVILNNWGQIQ